MNLNRISHAINRLSMAQTLAGPVGLPASLPRTSSLLPEYTLDPSVLARLRMANRRVANPLSRSSFRGDVEVEDEIEEVESPNEEIENLASSLDREQRHLLRNACMMELVDEFFQYASIGHFEAVKMILESGFLDAKTAKDVCGNTVLHFARHLEIVKLCVDTYFADVNATNDLMWSPLHWAAECENPALVWTLLEFGADPTQYTNNGSTPRDLAQSPAVLEIFDRAARSVVDLTS